MRRALGLAALAVSSCSLDTGVFAGKTCDTIADCPPPYTCAQVRPEARTCELLRGVDVLDTSGDNPAYYCNGPAGGRDIHTVVSESCVSNCHGSDMGYSGVPHTFRLDLYDTVPGFLGAKSQAASMKNDVDNGIMPPMVDGLHRPSSDDKALITQWVNSGALFHPDGVVVGNDCDAGSAAPPTDAGSPKDGGSADAGDGGV